VTSSVEVRARIVELLRRDLIGPLPAGVAQRDADLQHERLREQPSWWYLTGYLAPIEDLGDERLVSDAEIQEEAETEVGDLIEDEGEEVVGSSAADDNQPPEMPVTRRRFAPSSIGLTVLVPGTVRAVTVVVTWGDYTTEPPLSTMQLTEEGPTGPEVEWLRQPRAATVELAVPDTGKGRPVVVPDSAAPGLPGGALELVAHARPFTLEPPGEAPREVRALSVFVVNRRKAARRRYADVAYAFQARLEIRCEAGLVPRHDLSAWRSDDEDQRIADLHYCDEVESAVGRNTSGGWEAPDGTGVVRRAWTDPLPMAEVERVAPNQDIRDIEFGMEALAGLAEGEGAALVNALAGLPAQYGLWIEGQRALLESLPGRRRATGARLIDGAEAAKRRIAEGIERLATDARARLAFRIANVAVARALRRRAAGASGDPAAIAAPVWRPFQLAFILLNLGGLVDKTHADRELVDLLFFPTAGGKTEAYLGLAAFAIAYRRLGAGGELGAGVTVIMRYTLRLLTLDQLSRAAGMICALELIRTDPAFAGKSGWPLLGTWPIEIGLWVGSDASPNILGGRGNTGDHTAVTRLRRFRRTGKNAPAPIKACPWCGSTFSRDSFDCAPNLSAPLNMMITCANPACDFTRDRPLPLLTVDEVIYRRLPAFLIATVDKFAGLPWVGEAGAFFGHVDRHDENGFYGAAQPGVGRPLHNDQVLDPPDLIVQDELHLISGPLGTVSGLYETAIDRLSTRMVGSQRVRPKIVASTATVRRARAQIKALFDRAETQIFPPPGIVRTDSWFAITRPADQEPARLYLGLAAQGRGPKLVFLRGLLSLMAAAAAMYQQAGGAEAADNPADPYMTALCYFNALRELGGARRIVEDEVADRLRGYGSRRCRADPPDAVFIDREIREPLELTSRVSTDDVAAAKARLKNGFNGGGDVPVDVALATNMISVGLDITRLGLMLVQGQPKTAAEYIQATSRVGRRSDKPGLVVTVLNLHKPRDRAHYESFRLFHRTFYRSVEATSVTPWAARALDRSLAAVVVAVARHLRPELTPERAVRQLRAIPGYREEVIDTIVSRAPEDAAAGGSAALRAAVERLLENWQTTVEELARMTYGDRRTPGDQLLHVPLDPVLDNLTPEHRAFIAARSMRDVEPNVLLRVRDPFGGTFRAEDVA
jgi:hypothetical protein